MTTPEEQEATTEESDQDVELSKETVEDLDAPPNAADDAKGGGVKTQGYANC